MLSKPDLKPFQELQICFLLESPFDHNLPEKSIKHLVQKIDNIEDIIDSIDILALKKRYLVGIRNFRPDWTPIFLGLLLSIPQNALRDYLLKELSEGAAVKALEPKLQYLLKHPQEYPDAFVWYFQKVVGDESPLFSNKEGKCHFLESFLILLNILSSNVAYRDLAKKMFNILSGNRYAIVRSIIEGTSVVFLKEFLLLVSKCPSLSDHDVKILNSLAAVVQPSLESKKNKNNRKDMHVIWTTEDGYLKTQERVRQIGTTEIVENAREIEAARALGDLRENSEYKFALEKRSRLQGEMKMLSDQLTHARIITKDDISQDEVGVGTTVDVLDHKGHKLCYTILGPWDADVDNNILSFQAKLVQSMVGCKVGERFHFRDEEFEIVGIRSYLK